MRSLPVLLIFLFFVVCIHSRPSQMDEGIESDLGETEYEGDKALSDESSDDSRLNDEAAASGMNQNERIDENKNSFEQRNLPESRADRSHSAISDYKPYGTRDVRNDKPEGTDNSYDDVANYSNRRQSKYIENKEAADQEAAQHLTNRNVNYYNSNRIHNKMILEDPLNKREIAVKAPNEQGDMIFELQNQASQTERIDFNNEPIEMNQHYSKYTQMHPENREQCKSREEDHLYYNRDRRDTKDSNSDSVSKIEATKESDKNQNEDEETAIRRHIKKLSSNELEELLSSLSEDKRQLLKTIIDDTDSTVNINDSLNKREITKKAGAVEENTYVESGQADSSNIQGELSTADPPSQSLAEAKKLTETQPDISNSKNSEISTMKKAGLINQSDATVRQKSEALDVVSPKTAELIAPNEQVTTKREEKKRETHRDDLADVISFEDPKTMDNDWLIGDSKDQEGCFCSQDDDLSQFLDDEQATSNDDSKVYKRDVDQQTDYDAKMKSLEESFPISTNYDESAGPLIRVKRKNELAIKKRSAAVLPDAKIAFFPYRAENDDDDNDEGSEFDDDGFYDRTPNFSSNESNKPAIRDASSCKLTDVGHDILLKNVSQGTMSLVGSDTDSVLSGVEGVDENLMFSSGTRNRRTTEDISDVMEETNSIHNAKSLSDETKIASDMNVLTYQESDSFGPLPRNNEGESGRYKRIRRVKQSHTESPSDS